jgi:hypothetical protein
VLDPHRVFADEPRLEVLHGRLGRAVGPERVRLADAVDAGVVRGDLDEAVVPLRDVGEQDVDGGDLHENS